MREFRHSKPTVVENRIPLWLAPIQVVIVPITDDQHRYAEKVAKALREVALRVQIMTEAESMQNKIRRAEEDDVPYILVVGRVEATDQTVSVRRRTKKNDGIWTLEKFIEKIQKEIANQAGV